MSKLHSFKERQPSEGSIISIQGYGSRFMVSYVEPHSDNASRHCRQKELIQCTDVTDDSNIVIVHKTQNTKWEYVNDASEVGTEVIAYKNTNDNWYGSFILGERDIPKKDNLVCVTMNIYPYKLHDNPWRISIRGTDDFSVYKYFAKQEEMHKEFIELLSYEAIDLVYLYDRGYHAD